MSQWEIFRRLSSGFKSCYKKVCKMDPTKVFQEGRAMRRQNVRKARILVVKWHQAQTALLRELLGDDADGRGLKPPS